MGDYLRVASNGEMEEANGGTTGGGVDANKLLKLDGSGKIPTAALPTGVGAETDSAIATEILAAGDFVEVYDNTGTKSCRKATAAAGSPKPADGFVIAGVANGAAATIYFDGLNNGVTGIATADIGKTVFLSPTTAGGFTFTPPTTAGQILQRLGVATGTGQIAVSIQPPITRA